MIRKVIFATGNAGKMKEIRMILEDMNVEVLSMKEAGLDPEIVEDGTTFEENALIKARAVAACLQEDAVVLADDSGLEIDYLNGEPGIYSARYMGEDTSYRIKNAELIRRLEGVEKEERTARFVCALAAASPETVEMEDFVIRGTIEGYIGWEERGENGFGYDPIFYVDEYGCSTAELDSETKNQISHRGNALRLVKEKLIKMGMLESREVCAE